MITRKKFYERKSTIVVYPLSFSFDFHPNFSDFYSTLVYHEFYHAKQRSIGIRLDPLEEFMACVNQIKNFNSENSDKFKERTRLDTEKIIQDFRDFGPQILIDKTNRIYVSLKK